MKIVPRIVLVLLPLATINCVYGNSNAQHKISSVIYANTLGDCANEPRSFTEPTELLISEAHGFAACLRNAINTNNKQWVAAQVLYPIKVVVGNQAKLIHTENEFLKYYDRIIDNNIKQIAKNDTFWTVSKLDNGFMIADGQIWFMSLGPPGSINPVPPVKFYIVTIQ